MRWSHQLIVSGLVEGSDPEQPMSANRPAPAPALSNERLVTVDREGILGPFTYRVLGRLCEGTLVGKQDRQPTASTEAGVDHPQRR